MSQLPGKNASGMQVLIQGNQSSHVSKLLGELFVIKWFLRSTSTIYHLLISWKTHLNKNFNGPAKCELKSLLSQKLLRLIFKLVLGLFRWQNHPTFQANSTEVGWKQRKFVKFHPTVQPRYVAYINDCCSFIYSTPPSSVPTTKFHHAQVRSHL